MSEIEEGTVSQEDIPASDDYQDDSGDGQYQDNNDNQVVDGQTGRETENERNLRLKVEEQDRIIRLLQDVSKPRLQEQRVPEFEYDPDDIPSYRNVDHIVESKLREVKSAQRKMYIDTKVNEARRRYTDYDKVVSLGQQLVGNNDALARVILDTLEDPAEFVYNLGRSHPSYSASAPQDVVGKVKKNLNRPNTLNQTTGRNPSIETNPFDLSKEEFEKKVQKVKFGR
jgi:hypothetical protein